MLPTFIKLENTLEKAMLVNSSPLTKFFYFAGVHLSTTNEYNTYVQRTYAEDGIELEDYICRFYTLCGKLLTATVTTDTFKVIRVFQDPDTGRPQIEWSLNTTGLDFGDTLVYMQIQTGANDYVYSSPFTISDAEADFTSQWWYRNEAVDTMLSIGLKLYFLNNKSSQEISSFSPVGSGYIITGTSRLTPFQRFRAGILNIDVFEEFKKLFQCREVYSKPYNFNELPLRTVLYEALDSIDPVADENFGEMEVLLSRNKNRTYNPNTLPVIPPAPPVDPPTINLVSVAQGATGSTSLVRYTFTVDNFEPTYLIYQWSLDGINWTSVQSQVSSPRNINVPGSDSNDFYYRITHPQATSNIKKIVKKTLSIQDVVRDPVDFNRYSIFYGITGYTPIRPLFFEFSSDNIGYKQVLYDAGNDNPKEVVDPNGIPEPWIRISDEVEGIRSEPFKYTE